jgi:hypothetical protein
VRHRVIRSGDALRPILVNRGVVRLPAEVYAIGLGVTLGDCDDPWIWSGRACDNRRTFKRRSCSNRSDPSSVSGSLSDISG